MKITAKCYYALIASVVLSRKYDQGPQRASDIAEANDIPHRFLELTLNELRSAGIVDSKRGADGGFSLKKSPENVCAYDIVKAIDGEISIVDCDKLSMTDCPLKGYMGGLRAVIIDYLKNATLKELAESWDSDSSVFNYVI